MSDETNKARGDLRRADEANALLANPLYIEAVTVMRAAMFEEFESTKLSDIEARHELWQRMQLMKQFQGRFESIVKTGKRASQTLTMLEKAPDTLR